MSSKPTKNQPTPPDQLTANEESEKAKAAAADQASQTNQAKAKTEPKTEPKKKKPWSAPVLQFLDEEGNTDSKTNVFSYEDRTTTVNGKYEHSNPS